MDIMCKSVLNIYIKLIQKTSTAVALQIMLLFYNSGEDCYRFFQYLLFIETYFIQSPTL